MFGWFKKDPIKDMEKEYMQLLEKARDTQRKGDIKGFAALTAEAEALADKIEEMQKKK